MSDTVAKGKRCGEFQEGFWIVHLFENALERQDIMGQILSTLLCGVFWAFFQGEGMYL